MLNHVAWALCVCTRRGNAAEGFGDPGDPSWLKTVAQSPAGMRAHAAFDAAAAGTGGGGENEDNEGYVNIRIDSSSARL